MELLLLIILVKDFKNNFYLLFLDRSCFCFLRPCVNKLLKKN